MMDITRNQYFFAGLVLLLLGLEFNMVDNFLLNAKFTQFLAERTSHPMASVSATTEPLFPSGNSPIQKSLATARMARMVAHFPGQRAGAT